MRRERTVCLAVFFLAACLTSIAAAGAWMSTEGVKRAPTPPTDDGWLFWDSQQMGMWYWYGDIVDQGLGVKLTPTEYPVDIDSTRFYVFGANPSYMWCVRIYDDDGPGGTPGTQLYWSSDYPSNAAGWIKTEILPGPIRVNDGSFYVFYYYRTSASPPLYPYVGLDDDGITSPNPNWIDTIYGGANHFHLIAEPDIPADWMIEAHVIDVPPPGPDLVVDKVSGVNPGAGHTGTVSFTLTLRNRGSSAYPAGTDVITIGRKETRPSEQGQATQSFSLGSPIAPGGFANLAMAAYTPQNTRPGPIEFTFNITSTVTPEPTANNQASILVHFYDNAQVMQYLINESFNDGLASRWTPGGTGTMWDTTRHPLSYPHPTHPPTFSVQFSETHIATDSKNGNYLQQSAPWLQYATPLNLVNVTNPFLVYSEKYDLELAWDSVVTEVSTNAGVNWTDLRRQNDGNNPSWPRWDTVRVSLAAYVGEPSVLLRFRLTSDMLIVGDGWYIDDVVVGTGLPVPSAPNLVAPPDFDTTKNQRPTFSWTDPSGLATDFRIQVDDQAGCPSPLYNELTGGPASWVPPANLAQGTWYWRVAGVNGVGQGPWSVERQLTIDITPPAMPVLEAPPEDTTFNNLPLFNWAAIADARRFNLALRDNGGAPVPGYPVNITQAPGEDKSYYQHGFDAPLADGRYTWAVEALDKAQNSSGYCGEHWFWVDRIPPALPTLEYPIDGEVISTGMPTLQWEWIPDARHYNLEVYDEFGGLLFAENITQTPGEDKSEYQVLPGQELPDLADYSWTVEAMDYANNRSGFCPEEGFRVEKTRHDVAATAILVPAGDVLLNTEVHPKVTVYNDGEAAEDFDVRVTIDVGFAALYDEVEHVTGLAVGQSRDVDFAVGWTATPVGDFQVKCTTELAGDADNSDDKQEGSFVVVERPPWPEGWVEVRAVPNAPTAKAPKDGAWLAVGPDQESGVRGQGSGSGPWNPRTLEPLNPSSEVIYAAKGYKTTDFFKYYPADGDSGTWAALKPIPTDEEGRTKPPSKGCRGISDNEGAVYMVKGNNTLGFWRYDIQEDTWGPLTGVPLGRFRKRVKGGEDLVYVPRDDTGWVYLLKGYKTEFYRYNIQARRWDSLPEVPYGLNKQKYDKGSFLVYDDDNTIYAHQAKYYDRSVTDLHHYMFRYDIAADSWYHTAVKGMPIAGLENGREGKKKKSKDGGSGAWFGGSIYALKGGNTQGFFKYFPVGDTWTQLDTVPGNGTYGRKKRVKAGGDIVAFGGAFFALKGNKTYEAWRYVEGTFYASCNTPYARSGVQAGLIVHRSSFIVSPNPLASGWATLRLSLPKAGPVSITVFDVAGRSVSATRSLGHLATGLLPLDLRKLSSGVYLVRLDAEGLTQTQKLVVQR